MPLSWSVKAEADADVLQAIAAAVNAHVRGQAMQKDATSIACLVHDGDTLIAGGSGCTEYRRLFVHALWVAEAYRGRGIGSRMLRELEAEALRRGCRDAIIETLDDVVADLYRRLGYGLVAHLPAYLGSCDRHIMVKPTLEPGDDVAV
jgi:GNAT superfamily N-acetyltransferase